MSALNVVAATALVFYEWFLMSDQEFTYLVKTRLTIVKILYFLARYHAMVVMIVNTYDCLPFIVETQGVSIQKTECGTIITTFVLSLIKSHEGQKEPSPFPEMISKCVSARSPDPRWSIAFLVLPRFDIMTVISNTSQTQAIYLVLTLWAMRKDLNVNKMSPLLSVICRDGAGYFIIILILNTGNVAFHIVGAGLLGGTRASTIADRWLVALTSIAIGAQYQRSLRGDSHYIQTS
ncbi:hypothetical protein BU17DRAFT_71840 [Hysterangium stoloniferum]|nr:hypothetical protein BU17DRAFT_71840 [Hysterangium stoloniferum]